MYLLKNRNRDENENLIWTKKNLTEILDIGKAYANRREENYLRIIEDNNSYFISNKYYSNMIIIRTLVIITIKMVVFNIQMIIIITFWVIFINLLEVIIK